MKRKIAAILAADIAGYSRLIAEDEEDTLRRLAVYRGVFAEFVERFQGRIFNTAGDSVLAEFQSAVDAVRCAIDVQETLRARNLAYPQSRHMNFRIGVTIGDVVERDGDLLGDGVNIAARLESIASPGGICLSRSAHEAVASKLSLKFADAGMKRLKNIPEPVHAYTVALGESAAPSGARAPRGLGALTGSRRFRIAGAALAGLAALAVAGWLALAPTGPSDEPEIAVTDADDKPAPAKDRKKTKPVRAEAPESQEPAAEIAVKPAKPPTDLDASSDTSTVVEPETGGASPASKSEVATASPAPAAEPLAVDPLTSRYVWPRQMKDCREGEPALAVDACRALVASKGFDDQELAEFNYKLGRALREQAKQDEAIAAYDASIELKPSAAAHIHRGVAYYDKQDLTRAIDEYTAALKLDPKSAEAANNRAWARFKDGKLDAALADANLALRLNDQLAYAWDTRANINEALGKRSAAVSDFRRVLKLDPESAEAKEGLARLETSQ